MTSLLRLPRELRDKIWGYTLANEPADFVLEVNLVPGKFFYPNSLPAAAFIHPTLFGEVFLAWVRTCHFEFKFDSFIPPWFVWCMDLIAEGRAWPNVKQMSFTTALRVYEPHQGIFNAADLVARATTLQHLTITVSSLSLVYFNPQSGDFTHLMPIEDVLANINFLYLFRCEHLQTLEIKCCPTWKGGRCLEAEDLGCEPQDLFMPLLTWLWMGFQAHQRRVVQVQGRLERRGRKFSEEPNWAWMA